MKITGKLVKINTELKDLKQQVFNQSAYVLDEIQVLEKSTDDTRKESAIRNIKDTMEYLRGYIE